jgi:hypothetical protein
MVSECQEDPVLNRNCLTWFLRTWEFVIVIEGGLAIEMVMIA